MLANSCLEIGHFDVSIFIFVFLTWQAHNVHKQLSVEMSNSRDLFPVMCLAKWNLEVCFQYVANESRRLRPFNSEIGINTSHSTKFYVCVV